MTKSAAAVSVQWGTAATFWDVSFTEEQRAYADVDLYDMTGISVFVDPDDGEVELNACYAEHTDHHRNESALFALFKNPIIDALAGAVPELPEYEAFRRAAAEDAGRRREAIDGLAADIDESVLDPE